MPGRPRRWLANDKSVEDDTDGPGINFETLSVCRVKQYLWRNIVWRAADRFLPLAGVLDKRGQAKVPDFSVHVLVKEKIARLEVAVNDLVGAQVVAGTNKLNNAKPSFWL